MVIQKIRGAVLIGIFLSLPVSAAEACSGCGGLFNWGRTANYAPYSAGYAPYSVGYAPYVASYAPAGYGQVVNYMPQTAYRTVIVNSPVVAYSPVTACNACGGATTVMRPVTTYVTAARLVPYVTYRPVVVQAAMPVAPPCATGCGVAAPVTAAYAPAVAVPAPVAVPAVAAPMAAPVSAGYAPPATVNYPPMTSAPPAFAPQGPSNYASGPNPTFAPGTPGASVRSLGPGPADASAPNQQPISPPYPTDSSPGAPSSPKTFDNSAPPAAQPESRVVPPRNEASGTTTSGAPRALERADTQDRVTVIPLRQTVAMRSVSMTGPVAPAVKISNHDDSGWRAARN